MSNNGNIILNVIKEHDNKFTFYEYVPINYDENSKLTLINDKGKIRWEATNQITHNNVFIKDNRIGIGRFPLHSYIVDIDCSTNTRNTALHIGDGTYGFSFGNATNEGFIPQIVGVGSKETNTSLYFLGISPNENESTTPLIVFDARNSFAKKITNRPLIGFTSADYENYSMIIDASDNLIINGNLHCNDIIVNGKSLNDIIKNLH